MATRSITIALTVGGYPVKYNSSYRGWLPGQLQCVALTGAGRQGHSSSSQCIHPSSMCSDSQSPAPLFLAPVVPRRPLCLYFYHLEFHSARPNEARKNSPCVPGYTVRPGPPTYSCQSLREARKNSLLIRPGRMKHTAKISC